MTTKRQRFHPSVILVYFIRNIRSWIFLIFLLFINNNSFFYNALALGGIVLFVLITSLVKYFTHTYQISPERIIVYRGLLKKRETDISYDRIQTIKQRQWFFFKPFNVVEVLIETASTSPGEAEASLSAVDHSLVDTIEQYRNKEYSHENTEENEQGVEKNKIHFALSNKDITLYALTDAKAILILLGIFTFITEWIPEEMFTEVGTVVDYFQGFLIIFLFLFVLFAIALLSLAKNFIKFYRFQSSLKNETLILEYGLFERKVQTIPLSKIQGIRLHKQLVRALFNRSSVELIIMGGQEKEEQGLSSVYLFPLIHNAQVYEELANFLPNIPLQKPLIQKVSQKRLWYFWRWKLLIGIPGIVIGFNVNLLLGIGLSIVLIVVLLLALKATHTQGYTIEDRRILVLQQFQGLSTIQLFIAQKNIQAFVQSTSLWLEKKQLGHLKVAFKEGELPKESGLKFIAKSDAETIHRGFWNSTI
ncbi:PH domain-containing protein [Enterococcus eurekensis]|uniref:PH domain-containing protein n=1 Tax=Enterococcus eurekensis TaxID=1159753 RepID=A0ABV9M133_9ENTE